MRDVVYVADHAPTRCARRTDRTVIEGPPHLPRRLRDRGRDLDSDRRGGGSLSRVPPQAEPRGDRERRHLEQPTLPRSPQEPTMIRPAVMPPPLPPSRFASGRKPPSMRAAEVPGMCSVNVQDLFDDIPDPIHRHGEDIAPVRAAAQAALSGVDMSMIKPDDSVHILCSEHGFGMMGGHAYAELIKTIRDEVVARTGATKVKLALSSAASKFE